MIEGCAHNKLFFKKVSGHAISEIFTKFERGETCVISPEHLPHRKRTVAITLLRSLVLAPLLGPAAASTISGQTFTSRRS